MGQYINQINTVAHTFNNSTLMIGKDHKAQGIDSFEWERDEDEATTQEVADGTTILVLTPSTKGVIKLSVLESSPTTNAIWELYRAKATFPMTFTDTAAPDLKFSAVQCMVQKVPATGREKEAKVVEWLFVAPYISCNGAGYRLEEV